MLPILLSSLSFGGAILFLYWVYLRSSQYLNPQRKLPYPPGPPPRDFILGNARDLLSSPLWLALTEWGATYGSVVHLRALDKHLIVLNSIEDAVELLDKRSHIYSDRPFYPMLDVIGATFTTVLRTYGPIWHAHRRLFQQKFNPRTSLEYRPMQAEKVYDMLYNLLDTPEDFMTHTHTLSVSVIMSAMYGYKVLPKNDPFEKLAEEAVNGITGLAYPDATIVNVLPFLRFIPAWFPGASFHRVGQVVREKVDGMRDVPFKYVEDNLAAGTASPSVVASLIETCESEEDYVVLKEVAGTGYGAAADTTTSAVGSFIYAMAKYPHIQKKAQEEVERVIGTDRLANYDDEASLPYVQSIYREVMRWKPPGPLGIFHANATEDTYNGYYIPKGSTVIPNIWAMSHDPLKYRNPDEFDPDRFFDENNKLNDDDMTYVFGFGRRLCPGRHMGSSTVWLGIATILSTFNIRTSKDAMGEDIPLDVKYSDGIVSHPLPFKCTITPRSIQAKQLILDIKNNSL